MIRINWKPSPHELRIFAIGQMLLFAVVAARLSQGEASVNFTAGIVLVSAVVGLLGLIQPSLVRWVYLGWMIAVFPIGWCVSQILLTAVFVLFIIPLGFVLRCFGIDPLSRRFEPSRSTYWTKRGPTPSASRYFRPF